MVGKLKKMGSLKVRRTKFTSLVNLQHLMLCCVVAEIKLVVRYLWKVALTVGRVEHLYFFMDYVVRFYMPYYVSHSDRKKRYIVLCKQECLWEVWAWRKRNGSGRFRTFDNHILVILSSQRGSWKCPLEHRWCVRHFAARVWRIWIKTGHAKSFTDRHCLPY